MIFSLTDLIISCTLYLNALALLSSSSVPEANVGLEGMKDDEFLETAALLATTSSDATSTDGNKEALSTGGSATASEHPIVGNDKNGKDALDMGERGESDEERKEDAFGERERGRSGGNKRNTLAQVLYSKLHQFLSTVRVYSCVIAAWNLIFLFLICFVFRK